MLRRGGGDRLGFVRAKWELAQDEVRFKASDPFCLAANPGAPRIGRTILPPLPPEPGRMASVKSAYIDALGDAASIRYGDLPDPVAGPDQVLVRVEAVAVNNVDTFVRSGRWPTEVHFPLAIGRDLVGTVAAVGASVTGLEPGQRVWTNSAGYGGRAGATAELVAVEHGRLYELPDEADSVEFVAAVHPGATAHGALVGRARLQADECVAVIGANGSVGMCMVEMAASQGAEAIAVIRDELAGDRLRALGAAHIVIAHAADAPRAAAGAASSGVDVFVDTTRHVDITAVPGQLNPRGRIVLVASQGRLELDLWRFYTNEIQLLGFIMSAMTPAELAAAAEWINATYRSRPLSVSVGQVLGFENAAEAHAVLESGRLPRMADGTVGRLVLRP
jgi:NADPH:quinone reductase-like Zn-dependent oxidoreductase